jgi:hypothetical protein
LQTLSSACHGALSPAHSSALSWSFLCFDQWEIAQPAACMVWILSKPFLLQRMLTRSAAAKTPKWWFEGRLK